MLASLTDRLTIHPKRTLLLVGLFVVLAGVFGGPVAGLLKSDNAFRNPDSGSADATHRIEQATGAQETPGVLVLAPAAQAARLASELRADPAVAHVAAGGPALTSRTGDRAALAVSFRADADAKAATKAMVARYADRPGVRLGGDDVASTEVDEQVTKDLGAAELLAFPLLALLSLLFFRNWRAALLPLAVGVSTILGTFLALRGANEIHMLSVFALNLVIGLGLGLAVDYTLFLVSRFREELGAATEPAAVRAATRATMATAGRTVMFSAATVSIALASLLVFPLNFLQSMGIGGALVAVVAAAMSLVLAPAVFVVWGAKLQVRSRATASAAGAGDERQGGWYRLSRAVMRRPGLVAAVTAAALIAVALPAFRAQWSGVDASVLPAGASARVVSETMQRDFPQVPGSPMALAISAPASDRAAVAAYATRLRGLEGVTSVSAPRLLGGETWQVDVAATGTALGEVAQRTVREVRAVEAPFPVAVGGAAARFHDQQAGISGSLPAAVLILALSTVLILWLMTGSVLLPLQSLVMNALTVGAATGVLTLIFQDGRLEGLLGYEVARPPGIESADFVVTAALVFALSTDYGVFLLARIKEARQRGLPEREAIALGLQRTGGIVTAAAILLAVAIGAFVTSQIVFLKQIGLGVAVGVLVDAFVVRGLLVPSLLALGGRWTWWSPAPLRRLHDRIGVSESGGAGTRGGERQSGGGASSSSPAGAGAGA